MCFVFECITGFFEMLIAWCCHIISKLASCILYECLAVFVSSREFVYNMMLLQCTLLLLWTMRLKIVSCLSKILNNFPRRMLLHLCSFYHQHLSAQSTSVYVVRVKSSPFGYHSPKSKVPFKYLNIHLTTYTCVSLGAS
jgi:hypothetical protein